jgi:transmembrane sensor
MKGTEPLDELIIRVLNGEATPEERDRVERWRQESPKHEARYAAVRRVWTATPPDPLPGAVDLSVVSRIMQAADEREQIALEASAAGDIASEQIAPEQVSAEAGARPTPLPRPQGRVTVLRWALPLAATLAAVAFGVYQWSRGPAPGLVLQATGTGSETFVLDDGSFVRLAPGSSLRQHDVQAERRFTLEGRGLFAVAHDQTRPFVVVADEVETRVLGTRFEVRALDQESHRVAVLEGRVEVSNARGSTEVTAGEVSVAEPDSRPTTTRPTDVLSLLDWPEGALLFHDTPLAQVAREVERSYGIPVVVEGDALGARRISAWFGSEPFQDVVESLCAAANATCTVSDTVAVLR